MVLIFAVFVFVFVFVFVLLEPILLLHPPGASDGHEHHEDMTWNSFLQFGDDCNRLLSAAGAAEASQHLQRQSRGSALERQIHVPPGQKR